MLSTCQHPNHSKEQIIFLCTNSQCSKDSNLCFRCLKTHQNCLDHLIHIRDTKSSFDAQSVDTRQVQPQKDVLDNLDDIDSKRELLEYYQELLEGEFEKLSHYFGQRINETKLLIIDKAKSLYETREYSLMNLRHQLKKLYKFGTFPTVMEALNDDHEKATETIKKGLETLFSGIETKKKTYNSNKERTHQRALSNSSTLNYHHLHSNLHNQRILSRDIWKWDPLSRSDLITLSENHLIAEKRARTRNKDSAILGSLIMYEGFYKWEIEVESHWICFGIINPYLIDDLEAFCYRKSIGMDTARGLYGMERVHSLNDYKNKKYICELDMENGSFKIFNSGKVIARYKGDLKDQGMIPFVDFYNAGGKIKLKII